MSGSVKHRADTEFYTQLLDTVGQVTTYREACRIVGTSPETLTRWQQLSRIDHRDRPDGPSDFYFEYQGETKYFHQFMRDKIGQSIEEIEKTARHRAEHGTYAVSMFKGQTVYKRDPLLIGRLDLQDMLSVPDDYLRDETGALVPEMKWEPPSTDLVAMVLAAHSQKYRRQSKIDIDMRASVSGGVMVLGGAKQPAALPVLEIVEDAAVDEVRLLGGDDDPEMADILGPEPAPVAPVPPVPPTTRKLSALEADLLARLNAPASVRSAPVGAAAAARRQYDEDSNPDRMGHGPKPIGFKVG